MCIIGCCYQVFGGDYLDRWIAGQVMGFLDLEMRRQSDLLADGTSSPRISPTISRTSSVQSGGGTTQNGLGVIGEDHELPIDEAQLDISACATFGSVQSLLGHSIADRAVPAHDVFRALGVLPALPWLRGLAKAIRGVQVSGLVQAAVAR